MLARFHRSRVCGNRPRTALAISKNDECCTYARTDKTDRQTATIMAPCTHPGVKRLFCLRQKTASVKFILPCGRDAAECLLAQVNLGTTAAVALPAATAVEHCEPLLCVCFCCRWVRTWMPYFDEAPISHAAWGETLLLRYSLQYRYYLGTISVQQ